MNVTKKELVVRVAQIIRNAGYRKTVKIPKHSFTISDNQGNTNRFDVTGRVKKVPIDEADVAAVIEACMECVWETLARGDAVKLNGLGILGVKTRAASRARRFDTGEVVDVPERRLPYFTASNKLKAIAKVSSTGSASGIAEDIEGDFDDFELDGE